VYVDNVCVYDGAEHRLMNKKEVIAWIKKRYGVDFDPKAVFDMGTVRID
jgi:hypothetical protein